MSSTRNKAGREIWFRHVEGGSYRAVAAQGTRAFILAGLWLLLCGVIGMTAFSLTLDARCFLAMLVAGRWA